MAATEVFLAVNALAPDNVAAWQALHEAVARRTLPEKLLPAFRERVTVCPGDARALYNLGLLSYEAGLCEEALACWHRVIEVDDPGGGWGIRAGEMVEAVREKKII